MPNPQNVKPYEFKKGQVNSQEAAKNGRKGGLARGRNIRARKTAYEITKMFLDEKIDAHGKKLDRKQLMLTNAWKRINNSLMSNSNKALSADELKSLDYILQLVGEAPIPKTQQEVTVSAPIQIVDDVDSNEYTMEVDTDTKPEEKE